jgi:hypothetical protein
MDEAREPPKLEGAIRRSSGQGPASCRGDW